MRSQFKMQKAILLIVTGLFGWSAQAIEAPVLGEGYIVKLKSSTEISQLNTFGAGSSPFQILGLHKGQLLNLKFKASLTEAERAQQLETLRHSEGVEYVVRNYEIVLEPSLDPLADPEAHFWGKAAGVKEQWGLEKIRAPQAWKMMSSGSFIPVRVAVIDSGVDAEHQDLKAQMEPGYDFIENDNTPQDEVGHGTHCAGVIAGLGSTSKSMHGIAPNVRIVPIRMLDGRGHGDLFGAIKAIDYAIERKVDVISASWGGKSSPEESKPLVEAIARAGQAGIVFVVAAANMGANNDSTDVYPANAGLDNVISVAAMDVKDKRPRWSNYGQKVDIAAPGSKIISTVPKNKYKKMSGTSMAAPHVAGLVALLKSYSPGLNPVQMKEVILKSGVAMSGMPVKCGCRIDALNAVEFISREN